MTDLEDPGLLACAVPCRGGVSGEPLRTMQPELLIEFLRRRGLHDARAAADGDGVIVTFGWLRQSDVEAAVVYKLLDEIRASGLSVRARRAGFSRGLAGFRVRRQRPVATMEATS